jgi:hypothetical protein
MAGRHRAVRHSGGAGSSRLARGYLAFVRGLVSGRHAGASLLAAGVGLVAWSAFDR